jgi:hypothetical protein
MQDLFSLPNKIATVPVKCCVVEKLCQGSECLVVIHESYNRLLILDSSIFCTKTRPYEHNLSRHLKVAYQNTDTMARKATQPNTNPQAISIIFSNLPTIKTTKYNRNVWECIVPLIYLTISCWTTVHCLEHVRTIHDASRASSTHAFRWLLHCTANLYILLCLGLLLRSCDRTPGILNIRRIRLTARPQGWPSNGSCSNVPG